MPPNLMGHENDDDGVRVWYMLRDEDGLALRDAHDHRTLGVELVDAVPEELRCTRGGLR